MALNGPLILRDAQGKLLTDTGDPVGFNGGTPVTIDRKLTITDQGGPWKVAGLEYDIATRLAESIIGPAINWIAGVPLNAGGEVWAEDAPVLFYAPNAIPITASGAVAMSVGVPPGGLPPLELADSITTSDNFTFVLSASRSITDEVFTTDSIGFSVSNQLVDTANTTDIATRLTTKALGETVATTDAINQSVDKSLADTTTLVDAVAQSLSKALTDSVVTIDNIIISRVVDVNLTDNVVTVDTIIDASEGSTQALADSINATDNIIVVLAQALADSSNTIDSTTVSLSKALADSSNATDNIILSPLISQNLADSSNATDNIAITLNRSLVDSVSTDDVISLIPDKDLADSASSIDNITKDLTKALVDITSSVDNVTAPLSINRTIVDDVITSDNITPVLGGAAASPADLFAAGELGFWLDPSDITTLFQNSAGTTPVTAAGQPVGYIADKSGRGNHFTQSTAADRPIYQVDANGKGYLAFSAGIEALVKVNPTISGDKMTIWMGVYKQSDSAIGTLLESSADPNANPLTVSIVGPTGAPANSPDYGFRTRGNGASLCAGNGPDTFPNSRFDVLQCSLNNGGATDALRVVARINSVQQTLAFTGTSGSGNYASLPFWIGARNGASNPFIGRIYGVICRFTASTALEISTNETWMAEKMGLPLAIASLFALNELGGWYDPSDKTTLFQDTAGTTPVTASGQTVARINDKSGRGLNLTQTTAASRPTYIEAGALKSLLFDGVDDWMISASTNFSAGGGIINLWTGLYTDTNPGVGLVAELSATSSGNNGTWAIQSPPGDLDGFYWRSKGTVDVVLDVDGYPVLATHVLHGQGGISSDFSAIRVDGVQALQSLADQGTGNHGTYPVYVGRRGGTTFPFKGNLYGLVWRHAACTPQQVIDVEQVLAAKSGITF